MERGAIERLVSNEGSPSAAYPHGLGRTIRLTFPIPNAD